MLDFEEQALQTAEKLFDELARETADPPGVSRDSFGEGEGYGHAMIAREADRLGLERRTDATGNLFITLPGFDRNAPKLMIGSHIDSVHHGGNFDGAAGIIAGLAVLERLRTKNATPQFDIELMVIRAEETVWFPAPYLGSRAAFGLLPRDLADTVRRSDTGRTLADHMTDQGLDPSAIRQGIASLDPGRIRGFIELHIEQGPVLIDKGIPVGIVTAIRGNMRYRFARITGETTHAGGVPRALRKDAVLAGGELLNFIESKWTSFDESGKDFVATIGEFQTNPEFHGITKVPGEVCFTLDFRSTSGAVLREFDQAVKQKCDEIAARRNVEIDLGSSAYANEALMDADMREGLHESARRQNIQTFDMASGGGHDCAVFQLQGVPAAMVFVANRNGSHNPHEAMEFWDFADAWRVLAGYVDTVAVEIVELCGLKAATAISERATSVRRHS